MTVYTIYDYAFVKVSREFDDAEDVRIALRHLSWVFDLNASTFTVVARSSSWCRERKIDGQTFLKAH